MDRARVAATGLQWRRVITALAVGLFAIGLVWLIGGSDLTTRRVDADSLRVETVTRRGLTVEVSANGLLLPREVEWIAARVEGRVSAIRRRAGEEVVVGDRLVELSNPELENSAEEAASALEGGRAELVSYEVDLQNQLLNQRSVALRAKFAYESALLRLDAETRLKETSDIIPEIDYRRTLLEVEQLRASHEIEAERTQKSAANIETQLDARRVQVDQLVRAMERARNKVDALTVRAGMTGIVQQMDLEIGQRLPAGARIARLARQDELYAELRVPARQAVDIAIGQAVVIDTRNGTVAGRISRVDPAVTEGAVTVDVSLSGPLPKGARPELQIEGTVTLAQLENALVVGKPSYGRANSQLTVYRLSAQQDYAERVQVKSGRASLNEIEIVSGLRAGDRIILSDSSDWQGHNRIRIH